MEENRSSEWMKSSFGLMHIEVLFINDAHGLGILDIELIEEFTKLKINSQLEEDISRKYKHAFLSKLWVLGAHALVSMIDKRIPRNMEIYKEDTIEALKEVLRLFIEVRVPLAKFQERGKGMPYSGVAQYEFDSIKGVGWKVLFPYKKKMEEKIFYRKDLGDSLLELLKKLKEDTHRASISA